MKDYYVGKNEPVPGNFTSNANLPGRRKSQFNETVKGGQPSSSHPKTEGTDHTLKSGVFNLFESNLISKDPMLNTSNSPDFLEKDAFRDISGYYLSNLEIYEDQLKEYLYDYYEKIDTLFLDSFYNKYPDILKRMVESHDMRLFAIKKSSTMASELSMGADSDIKGLLLYSIDEGERLTIYHVSTIDFDDFFNI